MGCILRVRAGGGGNGGVQLWLRPLACLCKRLGMVPKATVLYFHPLLSGKQAPTLCGIDLLDKDAFHRLETSESLHVMQVSRVPT